MKMTTCLLALLVLGWGVHCGAAEESEKKVALDQVPAVVKRAIETAVGKGKLVDIGEIVADGKTTYEIELRLDGREIDLVLDAGGVEISRNLESDKDGEENAKEDADGDKDGEDKDSGDEKNARFQHAFGLEHRKLSTTGRNRFFILEPGHQLILEGKDGTDRARLEVTVLDETKEVAGIATRVVEERETVNDKLVEVSRNYFAICEDTGSVFYFGEDVDIYRDGKVVEHEGAWLHGKDGASAGMAIPGECLIGAAYYQEYSPKKAMDRARIEAVDGSIMTPMGEFSDCLKVWEENPLDGDSETKTYAPGIGLVQDEGLLLVKHGFKKD